MRRERAVGESLWEAVLPAELRVLPAELGKVDAILDEDRFLVPFRSRLTATTGRPTIPLETYLRLMYLKHRYAMGYETLCREVSDSFTWRRFCRVGIDGRVPDPSTLIGADEAAWAGACRGAQRGAVAACGRAAGVALAALAGRHDVR